jgi:hypothetical protein
MLRRVLAVPTLFFVAGFTLSNAQTTSDKLAYTIPHLYGKNGLFLPNPFHSAHFESAFQQSFTPLNTTIASQLTQLPLASPASGFIYTFNPTLGVYSRTSESFGPIISERAETIGKNRLYIAASYQYFHFSTLDGISLNNLPVVFRHQQETGAAYEKDYITGTNSVALNINQFTLVGTYGFADRLDVSAAIPILNVHMGVTSDARIQRIAPPDPVFGQAHYFDPADPQNSTRKVFGSTGNASGIGDVTFRVKGTVWRGERSGFALGADVRVPSGDPYNFLGTGAIGLRPFAAVSYRAGRFAPHVNFGYEWNGNSVLAGDVTTATKRRLPSDLSYAGGLDIGINRRATFAFDILGRTILNGEQVTQTTYTDALGRSVPDIAIQKSTYNIVDGSAGFKINLVGKFLLHANVLFKLNDAGMRAKVVPLVAISYTL